MKVVGDHGIYEVSDDPFTGRGESELFPVLGEPYLYKRYFAPKDARKDIDRLTAIVDTGRRLADEAPPEHIARHMNLPVDLIRHAQRPAIAGVLLPIAPARFLMGTRPRELSHLYSPKTREPQPASVRMAVLVSLAGVLSALHGAKWVHGDVTAGNVLWAPDGGFESAFLVDCDGVSRNGDAPHGKFTLLWRDPRLKLERIRAHDIASDNYALALAIWRTIGRHEDRTDQDAKYGNAVVPKRVQANLPTATRQLLVECFARPLDASARADAAVWQATLMADFFPDGVPNTANLRLVDDPDAPAPPLPRVAPSPPPRPRFTSNPPPGAAAAAHAAPMPAPAPTRARPAPRRHRRWPAGVAAAVVSAAVLWVAGVGHGGAPPASGSGAANEGQVQVKGATASSTPKATTHHHKHKKHRHTGPSQHNKKTLTANRVHRTTAPRPHVTAAPTAASKPTTSAPTQSTSSVPPVRHSGGSSSGGLSGGNGGSGGGGLSGSAHSGGSGGGGLSGSAHSGGSGGGLSGSAGSGR